MNGLAWEFKSVDFNVRVSECSGQPEKFKDKKLEVLLGRDLSVILKCTIIKY